MNKNINLVKSIFGSGLFLYFLMCHTSVFATTRDRDSLKQIRKNRPYYSTVGIGVQGSKFRDFATSPIFYEGIGAALHWGALKMDSQVESELTFQYGFGFHNIGVKNEYAAATLHQPKWSYSYLRNLKRLSNDKWNIKAGAMANILINIRSNASLMNNGLGFESLNTLMVAGKVTRDISRPKTVTKKLLFLKFKLNSKKRDLSYRLNVGVLNNTLRNGYAYLNQDWLLRENSSNLDGYNYRFFSGMRAGAEINYTKYLDNGNAIRISYLSDVYHTGNESAKFEAAHHFLKFLLLFRSK